MNRRTVLAALALSSGAVRSVLADQPKVLGWLTFTGAGEGDLISDTSNLLANLGWTRGKTLRLERSVPLKPSELSSAAEELVTLRPDLVVANGEGAAEAVRARSPSLPLLFYNAFDPVRSGLVRSLAQPGGPTTGLIGYPVSLGAKWIQLLQSLVPSLSRIAVVHEPSIQPNRHLLEAIDAQAAASGIEVTRWAASVFGSLDDASARLPPPHPQAIVALPDPITFRVRRDITQFAQQRRIPTLFWYSDAVRASALISYGPDRSDLPNRLADRINRILRGTLPSSMPVEEPTRYELAINRLIASQFGLEIPSLLAAQADLIIE